MDTTKLLGLAALLFTLGCGSGEVAPLDAGQDVVTPPDTGPDVHTCGAVVGQSYTVHFARTMGACAASVDLPVTVTTADDLCGAVGQVRSDVFGPGVNDIACWRDSATCRYFAAVGAPDCQGSYAITF